MKVEEILLEKIGHLPLLMSGKTAVITGSGSGIGKQVALGLAHLGADIVVIDKDAELADTVVTAVKKLGRHAEYLQLDISKDGELVNALDTLYQRRTTIDIYIK